jgi:hypothetical protein
VATDPFFRACARCLGRMQPLVRQDRCNLKALRLLHNHIPLNPVILIDAILVDVKPTWGV